MKLAAAAILGLILTACSGGSSGGSASASRAPIPASAAPSATPTPAEPFTTQLSCGAPVTATHGLALYALPSVPLLEVLDVSNPLKPRLLCTLQPAQGGRFDQSPTQLIFWIGDRLGAADLTSGRVVQTGVLPVTPTEGFYSRDGTEFAYRVGDDTVAGLSTHVHGGGYDVTLYNEPPIGGHGGPPYGPLDQLEFSPDGKALLDYYEFRPASGSAKLYVYKTAGLLGSNAPPDSFQTFQSPGAAFGVWSASGSTLYFFVQGEQGFVGEVDSLDAGGQPQTVAGGINGFFWPRAAPGGGSIVYDAYDGAGLPHLWRLDLGTHAASQISGGVSSRPVFVSQTVVWSNEEKPCDCGPGGSSAVDGVIVAHDASTNRDAVVDATATVPGIGGPQPERPSTGYVLDVWL